jgi:hypothetical protein
MLSLSDVCRSRYLLYRGLVECGFETGRASLAVDVLLDEEEPEAADDSYIPSEEDWDDYLDWADRMDRESFVMGDDPDYISDRDILVATGCVG